jgi:hypothetical protein
MVAVAQGSERLIVNLRRRHNPEHETHLLLAVMQIHQVDGVRSEERLAAPSWDF